LERLNATYPIKLKILEALTGNKAVGICFGSCHCLGLVRFGITTIGGILPCDDKYTINPIILFSSDLIVIILIITISVCYIIVIMRLLKQQKYIGLILTGVSENQGARRNTSSLRMPKNALTLGMIIILSVITTLPRTITGMYSYAVGGSEKAISVMWLAKKIILVNPLVDLSFTFSG
jgi:Ca2+/Na+ antiporter